jgi:hypothetical protein
MLIALLAVLGVELLVIVVLLGAVIARRHWVVKQPGVFKGAIRTGSGAVDGVSATWGRGYGRWIQDVLVWTKAPFLLRNVLLASTGVEAEGPAGHDEVKRLGDEPVVLTLRAAGATVEVAAEGDNADLLRGPYRSLADEAQALS